MGFYRVVYHVVILWFSFLASVISNSCVEQLRATVSFPQRQVKSWAIVALAKPNRADIDQRNSLLIKKLAPFSHHHNITVIFFSEKTFPPSVVTAWTRRFKGVAHVRVIDTSGLGFNLPERYGYKYMCKFFSLDLYDHLQRDGYDYYMRCDTDCYLTRVDYDILRWVEESGVEFGFSLRKLEAHKPTAQTLPLFTKQYVDRCSIAPTAVMDVPLATCFNFYNNWHIGKVSFFARPDVRHFLEAVNGSGGILAHRWGDSTIQAYAVRLFMDPSRIAQVPNFTYVHGSHGNKLVSTFGDGSDSNVPQRLPNWKHESS